MFFENYIYLSLSTYICDLPFNVFFYLKIMLLYILKKSYVETFTNMTNYKN